MNRQQFEELSNKILYLDGATGSNLVKAGMPSGVCPEAWILDHKDVMLDLQKRYVQAGTDILYAPTFTANRIKLAEYGLQDKQSEMIAELVAISKEAAATAENRTVYVAGDLTMTGEQLKPMGNMELETLITIYKEQILDLAAAGADMLVVETMMSLAECRAALIAAKEVCDLPVMVTLTFEASGRTLFGTDAATAAIVLENLGAAAIGVNCSTGPADMRNVVEAMVASTRQIPIIAKPNAGLPFLDENGVTCYNMEENEFAKEMEVLVQAGATILGGCCGTTPDFIKAIHDKFGSVVTASPKRLEDGVRVLCSERQTLRFTLDENFIIVGERINPTGKKLLQAELREGKLDRVLQFAEEQEKCGARVLDVNMGMSGIDEKDMMLQSIEAVSGVTNLPLSLDSSHVNVLEAALRHYPGRALINSISFEKEKVEQLLPIAKKYGAMFILLPLSDKGLPENIAEKISIIEEIERRAFAIGLRKEDIVVDGLVATVGANKRAAIETLETIQYCKKNVLATICGLSNISFGMPERSYVNTAFLVMAIKEGLTMAIANPSQELLVSCSLASDLLLAKDESDIRYIDYVNVLAEKKAAMPKVEVKAPVQTTAPASDSAAAVASKEETVPCRAALKNAVLKGNRNGIAALTQDALNAGEEPSSLLNDILLPAINEVGEYFDKGKYFLPQLINSAEAMKKAIEVLEPLLLTNTDSANMPVVVIATVEGDIHDIGKNLVALMLKNYGFRVIDLGKDVPKEVIVETAKEHNAQIIALSALMTTTMQRMKEVIALAKEQNVTSKVMIGGAVITQDYADEIGADGYSKDAADAVKLAKRLTGSAE